MRSVQLVSFVILCLFLTGCAPMTYLADSGKEWRDRKEKAFIATPNLWESSYNVAQIPAIVREYVGFNGYVLTFANVDRIDYFYGYIYVRREQTTIPWWVKYPPFGIFSFEYMGMIGSNKEWISRPSLPAFVIQIGVTAATTFGGVALLAPTRVWEEECFHASQEILHPTFTKYSQKIWHYATLQDIPVIRVILSNVLYFFHPMEFDAKLKKWAGFGNVLNLDCDTAWIRYVSLVTHMAGRRCQLKGIRFTYADTIKTALDIQRGVTPSGPLGQEASSLIGIIHRRPYEEKLVYAPWVPGTMREKEELPWFSRTFLGWWLND